MRIKDGVRFIDGPAAMAAARLVVLEAAHEFNVADRLEITSSMDSHSHPSLHAYGAAEDYGTRRFEWPEQEKNQFAARIRTNLGDGFDVVYEDDLFDDEGLQTRWEHIHIEYQPKDWHR